MATTVVYDKILAELLGGELKELERKVLNALQENPEGLTRHDLVEAIFGYRPEGPLNGNVEDRKIRTAIKSLRDKGATFIVSSSGAAGYKIDMSPEKAEEMAGEFAKRARELDALADKIRSALIPVKVPASLRKPADHPLDMEAKQVAAMKQLSFIQ